MTPRISLSQEKNNRRFASGRKVKTLPVNLPVIAFAAAINTSNISKKAKKKKPLLDNSLAKLYIMRKYISYGKNRQKIFKLQ